MATYFLTWSVYGERLHGDERGSVARGMNTRGRGLVRPQRGWAAYERSIMKESRFLLETVHRGLVAEVIRAHCAHRGWVLHAMNVRRTHVHVVCSAQERPGRVMGEFKAWSSQRLREGGLGRERIWARHGSTRWIDSEASYQRAVRYVIDEQ